ncbi:antibiotic biosynthesis monooxygenase family protein [Aurantiacibacter gilvus]|uniref:Antibiotic biosynthesis monooxygenase n=1 Tax=Aurantiacibacter gilvus TaxID=3139141 RepID=A0ABU9IH55_9SPHN
MVIEIAYITIDPAKAEEFEAAVRQAAPHFAAAEGCHGMRLERVHEDPAQYRLSVDWETVDHHMVTFRESEGFQQWRALAGPFFVEPPRVEHWHRAGDHFAAPH